MQTAARFLLGALAAGGLALGASVGVSVGMPVGVAPDWDRWRELDLRAVGPASSSWRLAELPGTCASRRPPGRWTTCSRSWSLRQPDLDTVERDLQAAGWSREPASTQPGEVRWVRPGTAERVTVRRASGPADYPQVGLRDSGACRGPVDRWRITLAGGRCA